MKKEEFLDKLREKISILKKEEQDDIINEYREHIEEKLKKKEKEEKIIEELGSVDEIAKEILDAYKINEEYTTKNAGAKFFETCNNVIETIVEKFANKSFSDIMKFILEILVILLLIFILKLPFLLIESFGESAFNSLFTPASGILTSIWKFLIEMCYLVVAVVVFVNIFKVRYLSDGIKKKNVSENRKESHVKNKKDTKTNESKPLPHNKKHSVSAVDTGAGILYSFFKVIIVLLGLPFIFSLIFLCVSLGVMIFVGVTSNFFFGIILCILALLVGNIWLLDIIYRIVFDKPFHGLRLFFTFIGVIVAFTLGIILSFFEFTDMEIVENGVNEIKTEEKVEEIALTNGKTNIYCYDCSVSNQELVIDNSLNNEAKIKIEYKEDIQNASIINESPNLYAVYSNEDLRGMFDFVFDNLKENRLVSLDTSDSLKVTVYVSNKDLNKINFDDGRYYLNGVYQGTDFYE